MQLTCQLDIVVKYSWNINCQKIMQTLRENIFVPICNFGKNASSRKVKLENLLLSSQSLAISSIRDARNWKDSYEVVFGIRPQLRVVSTNLTIDAASILETEEQLRQTLSSEQLEVVSTNLTIDTSSILDTEEQLKEILNSEEEYSKQQNLGQDDIAPGTASITQQSEISNYNCVSCQQISNGAHTCMSCGLFAMLYHHVL
ncbi:hypothetical protein LOD99_8265 [Oopsacas minuta]|uniref:Uncharacterized protein n=1 Tax=Oopsacas minuta TaxID=111878 RepID=A0AAV7JGY4_9METZ|nr:hypothetical protein LOD99_8265 [Oopsacas minuta]